MKGSEKEFIAEAEDILEEAGRLILEIQDTFQSRVDPDTTNALFRALHTLKGLSGLFGHTAITEISHSLESILDEVRLGKIKINDDMVKFLFRSIDGLRDIISAIKDGKEVDATRILQDIAVFRGSLEQAEDSGSLSGLIDESILKVLSDYEEHRLKANVNEGRGIYIAKTVFPLMDFDKSLEVISKKIKELGELISTLPTSQNLPPDSIGFNLLFGSTKPLNEIVQALNCDVSELLPSKTAAPEKKEAPREISLKTASTTVRVDIEKLDRILNTIGELTLAKSAVQRISREMQETFGHSPLVIDTHKISQTLDRRLQELQDQVLEIRMVPIGQIFGRLSQVIRRYSREVGKQIELEMYGEDTEIDKYLAEEVIDPLVHIVRNAIDHGIEPPAERKRKGKKEIASVVLRAYQKGNHVVIEVSDDGKGIDIEKVRKKALEKGLITEDAELQRREIIELIFTPGFSTKDTVSEVSGRGVGLDIVKEKLSALGGFVDVQTELDVGTSFTLTLPITLALIKSLIVRVGTERFALPLTSIAETFSINEGDLQTIEGREVFNLRGLLLPITRLSSLFNISTDATDRLFAVVVGFGERSIGLLVNELLGQQEIVIKSLGDYFKGLKGFAGAAEIGKHEVILVVDVESVIEEAVRQRSIINV